MMLILIAGMLQPGRSYTVHANLQQDILYMLHGVLVFAPVVEVESSVSTSLWPHFILEIFLMVQSTLWNLFFNTGKAKETPDRHKAKPQGLLAISCESAAHSQF